MGKDMPGGVAEQLEHLSVYSEPTARLTVQCRYLEGGWRGPDAHVHDNLSRREMPLVPTVGRRTAKMRVCIAAMYLILSLGAVSVVYPFLLMLSTSITSSPDTNEFRVVPRYLSSDDVLFAKFVDDKYAGDLDVVNGTYDSDFKKAIDVKLPWVGRKQATMTTAR